MDRDLPTDTLTLAIISSRLSQDAADRLDGVVAWTDTGTRHYRPLTSVPTGPNLGDQDLDHLDATTLTATPPTSSGLTWRTWALPTIPPAIRDLTPAEAVEVLARALQRMPA
jgi:hypothetical protein